MANFHPDNRGRQTGYCRPGLEAKGHPTLLDIAWAAGIYEGEGSVYSGHKNSESLLVVQKDTWILYKLQYLFGGSISLNSHHGTRSPCSTWRLCGSRARGFLLTIFTWLSPRRRQQALRYFTFKKGLRKGTDNK